MQFTDTHNALNCYMEAEDKRGSLNYDPATYHILKIALQTIYLHFLCVILRRDLVSASS